MKNQIQKIKEKFQESQKNRKKLLEITIIDVFPLKLPIYDNNNLISCKEVELFYNSFN